MSETHASKRVRSSKSRDARFYTAKQTLTIRWRDAIRKHAPLHDTFVAISAWIDSLDLTISQRATLKDGNWTLRDYAVNTHARWQLYLDGIPRTFDEIAAIADAAECTVADQGPGPMHETRVTVMRRICGRHEWNDSHDPFYANEAPELLYGSAAKRAPLPEA